MIDQANYSFLKEKLLEKPQEDYPHTSRIHSLRSFRPGFFVKREDELGFGISGSKFRKYRTLIPFLNSFKEIVVVGGAFSNHVLGICQLLLENGITHTFFLKGSKPAQSLGNFFFLESLLSDNSIHWIPNSQWPHIQTITSEYAATRENVYILPEGGAIFPGFLGSLSLPLDIIRNEIEQKITFDHIFLDIGTGFTAAALILAFAFLKKSTHCHLLCVAGNEEEFKETVHKLIKPFEDWLGKSVNFPENYTCYMPTNAKSFGSTNTKTFDFIYQIARSEGFFLDPIYSGKLFYHAKEIEKTLDGNVLLIHSGGALSLSGFQRRIG